MTKSQRLLSLDTFRGLTIAGMILVNNPGNGDYVYAPLRHAKWHGITPTDFIFPFFLFIMGVSVAFAYSRQLKEGVSKKSITLKIFKRTAILFGLGLFLALFPNFDFENLRIPGVLQRIALVFFATALLYIYVSWKKIIMVTISLLVGYWVLMTTIPVPGVGYANLEPTTNLAAYIDFLLLEGHLYRFTKVWDPEGILSTFPAIASGLAGLLIGIILLGKKPVEIKIVWILIASFLQLVLGYMWDGVFPINKSLWTSSFVLYTSGLAGLFFGTLYWFVDVLQYKNWTKFFVVYGVNAIAAYFGSGIIISSLVKIKIMTDSGEEISVLQWVYQNLFSPFFSDYNASLAMALTWVLLFFVPLYIMYKKKIFIKV